MIKEDTVSTLDFDTSTDGSEHGDSMSKPVKKIMRTNLGMMNWKS